MKPTSNPLTIIKQRSILPLMKKAYTKNIKTWFDKKLNMEYVDTKLHLDNQDCK